MKWLRIAQGLVAFVIAWQVIGMAPMITWIGHTDKVPANAYVTLAVKLIILLLLVPLYLWISRRTGIDSNILKLRSTGDGHRRKLSAIEIVGIGMVSALLLWAIFGGQPAETTSRRASSFDDLIPQKSQPGFQPDKDQPSIEKDLGFFDQWRYDSCMTDAAQSPTPYGVSVASDVCRRRFRQ